MLGKRSSDEVYALAPEEAEEEDARAEACPEDHDAILDGLRSALAGRRPRPVGEDRAPDPALLYREPGDDALEAARRGAASVPGAGRDPRVHAVEAALRPLDVTLAMGLPVPEGVLRRALRGALGAPREVDGCAPGRIAYALARFAVAVEWPPAPGSAALRRWYPAAAPDAAAWDPRAPPLAF